MTIEIQMLNENSLIGVSSRSFSRSKELRQELEKSFKNIRYNNALIHFDENSLIEFFQGCEAVIVSEDKITKKVVDSLPYLKMVAKFGVGLDSIDLKYLEKKEIKLGWQAGINCSSVAELALSYIILMLREAYVLNRELLNLKWKKVKNSRDLSETTIGIIGFGNIGKKLASFLSPFECKILVFDPLIPINEEIAGTVSSVSLDFLLKNSHAISIHVPLTKETSNLIDTKELSMMKKNSVLVNLSRGGVVNETALYNFLVNKHLSGAAFDVFDEEPKNSQDFSSKLIGLNNFFSTPHIAGTSEQTIKKLGLSAINQLIENLK